MSDIKLFSTKDDVRELTSYQVTLEKELQQLLEKNMTTFFGVTFLKSEYKITNGRMDSIGIDENNCPVIFEYKRNINENVINQGLFYLDWLLDHKADFKILVMETLGVERAEQIDWSIPCVVCVANDFTKFDLNAVNQMKKNIKLVRYKKFEKDLLLLECLNSPQVKTVTFSENNKLSSKINSTYFGENLKIINENSQNLFDVIKDYILSLGKDVSENKQKNYIAFKKAGTIKKTRTIVCITSVNTHCIHLELKVNPDTVDLIQNFMKDIRSKHNLCDLRIYVKSIEDFEKIKYLIDRAYNEN